MTYCNDTVMSNDKVQKILKELEKIRDKGKDPLKQHPHWIESRKHWDWDVGMYDDLDKDKDEE